MTRSKPVHRGIHVKAVRKTFALAGVSVPALRGIDLEIAEPGFYAIMGPSGSGKSTLLHLLAALDRPDEGSISVAGHQLESLDERRLTAFRRRCIGIVFQQFNLIPTLTAQENIALPGMLDGDAAKTRRDRSMTLLRELGLEQRAHHRPDALSGGEQQRVAIARALYFEPTVLFADEPTGNLDSTTSESVWRLLRSLADRHEMIVLMVTHEPSAAAHCRRIFVLRDGTIHDTFEVEETNAAELATRAQHPVW